MAVLPLSGKAGFLIRQIPTVSALPIFFWGYSIRQNPADYRTSSSINLPVGTNGVIDEVLNIRSADYAVDFLNECLTLDTVEFDIGWFKPGIGTTKVRIRAMLTELRIEFNYTRSDQPALAWTATFASVKYDKAFEFDPDLFPLDRVVCIRRICDLPIETTLAIAPGGSILLLSHVRNAVITQIVTRPSYRHSASNQRLAEAFGVKNISAGLTVEGNFDNWLLEVQTPVARNYKFFYNTGAADWFGGQMKVASMENLQFNIQTGEIVAANVNLVSAYGPLV